MTWTARLGRLLPRAAGHRLPLPATPYASPWRQAPADTRRPASGGRIPRNIHCMWLGYDAPVMGDLFQRCFARMVALHPGWDIVLHDRPSVEACLARYPAIAEAYAGASAIAQCDIGRLAVLGTLGGIYLDLDVTVRRPLDRLFDDYADRSLITFTEQPMGTAGNRHNTRVANYALAVAPGDPVVDLCFDVIAERLASSTPPHDRDSDDYVIWSTGPDVVSTVIHGLLPGHSVVPVALPRDVDTDAAVVSLKETRRYLRHGGGATWRAWR